MNNKDEKERGKGRKAKWKRRIKALKAYNNLHFFLPLAHLLLNKHIKTLQFLHSKVTLLATCKL